MASSRSVSTVTEPLTEGPRGSTSRAAQYRGTAAAGTSAARTSIITGLYTLS